VPKITTRETPVPPVESVPMVRSLIAFCLFATACGGANAVVDETTTSSTTSTTTTTLPTTTTSEPDFYDGFGSEALDDDFTLVAMGKGEISVFEQRGDEVASTILPETTVLGTVTVLKIIEGPTDGWAKVMLPIRPNGSEGWVQVDSMDLFVVQGRVVVDLSDRTLTYYRGDETVIQSTVAVGTDRNPTPTGHFFVTDSVTMARPDSPWGPHALGLSGRSDTITEYNGGDGIIGIHGTNRPDSIGQAASLGCVRLPNEVITELHRYIDIGTPVEIRA
jgi:hypothetical protein